MDRILAECKQLSLRLKCTDDIVTCLSFLKAEITPNITGTYNWYQISSQNTLKDDNMENMQIGIKNKKMQSF